MITPSHNPPHDGGFKYNPPNGGAADSTVTERVGTKANGLLESQLEGVKRVPYEQALRASTTHRHDYLNSYINDLDNVIDLDVVRGATITVTIPTTNVVAFLECLLKIAWAASPAR